MKKGLKVLLVASESAPFVKSGGLGDVVGSLPKSLQKKNVDVRVVIPRHRVIKNETMYGVEFLGEFDVYLQWRKQRAKVLVKPGEVPVYFIENDYYFSRGALYGFDDDNERFAFFGKAVLDMLAMLDFYPDVIHCNDWQTGPVCMYLKEMYNKVTEYSKIKTLFTVHNLQYQGRFSLDTMELLGVSDWVYANIEFYNTVCYMKMGLVYADYISTVSGTYAQEIQTEYYGEGLNGLLSARHFDMQGIVNGIDYTTYNPQTDSKIYMNYDASSFRKKKYVNKERLQEELGLEVDKKKYMIGLISRLTDQKGLDLINAVMDGLVDEFTQLVVIGTGEPQYENMFRHYAWKYPNRVSANICYSDDLAHKLYAAADAFLMPSRFEPCGLTQMISFRYGTVPIVRETGGLKDTVQAYNEYDNSGDGFSFTNYNADEMLQVINYSKHIFYDRKRQWNQMVDRGMANDFSWNASKFRYEGLYNYLLGE